MIRLTQLRESNGWSKLELSRRARLAPADIGKIESGRYIPYSSQLKRVAKALRVPLSEAEGLLKEVNEEGNPLKPYGKVEATIKDFSSAQKGER